MFRRILSIVAVAALCSFASASSIDMSDSASLADLLDGTASLTVGGITIDNFGEVETAIPGNGTVTPVDPSTVGVTASICGDELELTFGDATGGLGGFVASASDGGTYDYLVSFDISGVAGGISSASLSQLAGGAGSSFANITETILFSGGGVGLNTDENTPFDSTLIAASPSDVSVAKDILLQSFPGGSAQISQFSQVYSIPEPSALGLGVFGLIGALGLTRRGRRNG